MKTSELDVLLDYTEELEDVVLDINSRLAQLEIREDSPLEGLQGKIKRVLAQRQEIEMLSQPERAIVYLAKALEAMDPRFPGYPSSVARRYELAGWEILKTLALFRSLVDMEKS